MYGQDHLRTFEVIATFFLPPCFSFLLLVSPLSLLFPWAGFCFVGIGYPAGVLVLRPPALSARCFLLGVSFATVVLSSVTPYSFANRFHRNQSGEASPPGHAPATTDAESTVSPTDPGSHGQRCPVPVLGPTSLGAGALSTLPPGSLPGPVGNSYVAGPPAAVAHYTRPVPSRGRPMPPAAPLTHSAFAAALPPRPSPWSALRSPSPSPRPLTPGCSAPSGLTCGLTLTLICQASSWAASLQTGSAALGFSTCQVCQRVLCLRFDGRCPSCFHAWCLKLATFRPRPVLWLNVLPAFGTCSPAASGFAPPRCGRKKPKECNFCTAQPYLFQQCKNCNSSVKKCAASCYFYNVNDMFVDV